MTTKAKSVEATGEFVKDTAKGKKHFRIEGDGVAGGVYLTPERYKALGEPEELTVMVTGA